MPYKQTYSFLLLVASFVFSGVCSQKESRMPTLASARYGKDNVRVCKVYRNPDTGEHTVTEMTVCCLLEGEVDASYTQADNSPIVATDTIKNTIYLRAKDLPVSPPELFASKLGAHFLATYDHMTAADISVAVHRWSRIPIAGKPHPHSFYRDSEEKRTVKVRVTRGAKAGQVGISIRSGIKDLSLLKSTGSAFHGFMRDEYTTLPDSWDRILSTDVDCSWSWRPFDSVAAVEADVAKFDPAWEAARSITTELFAEDASASVQSTTYKMAGRVLEAVPEIELVTYTLPNKHYFEIGELDTVHIFEHTAENNADT